MTIRDDSKLRITFLNKLKILKDNKILACNFYYMLDGTTGCDLYNKSNRKRIRIITSYLFKNEKFLNDPEEYIKNQDYFKKLIE
jgi:hypothetical protein